MAGFRAMAAGDTIAFCRGGRWTQDAEGQWYNFNCRATNTCDVRDYSPPWGDGLQGRPAIVAAGRSRMFGFLNPSTAQHQEGYRVLNIDMNGSGSTSWAVGIGDLTNDVTLCNVVIDSFNIAIQANPGPQRFSLLGSRITNNTGFGVLYSGVDGIVSDNYFDNNGGPNGSGLKHTIYLNGEGASTFARITNNEIHRSSLSGGKCVGTVIVLHGQFSNLLIENNLIDSTDGGGPGGGCWPIGLTNGGYPSPVWFRNTIIRGNRIYGVGTEGISISNCANCLIENNLIVANQPFDAFAIHVAASLHRTSPADDTTTAAIVRNNTIFFGAGSPSGNAIMFGNEGSGHVVAGNSINFLGTNTAAFKCFELGPPPGSFASWDFNQCWYPTAGSNARWTNAYSTLAAWRTATGFDTNSIQVAPQFTGAGVDATADFSLGPASPLTGAGNSAPGRYAPTDITGKPRDAAPDIGAYER
jgi:parallel beta-helix repeat protein